MLAFILSPSGRIGRAKWWLAQLVTICIILALLALFSFQLSGDDLNRLQSDGPNTNFNPIIVVEFLLSMILLIWMGFCITVKRYHDRGKSAWWYLIQFIPLIGGIWAFVELGFCSGDDGDNDYGPGPDFNIADDLKALQQQRGQPSPVATTSTYRPAPAPRTGGPVVFGKRG